MAPSLHDPYQALRVPSYRKFWIGGFTSVIGRQMLAVAVGYEIFRRTHSATALGLVGLMGALPIVLLSLVGGQFADRWNRKRIILGTQVILTGTSLCLALLATGTPEISSDTLAAADRGLAWLAIHFGESPGVVFGPEVPLIYLLLLINGTARAFGWPARSPLMAELVPREALPNAVMWNSSSFETGSIIGPAIGGVLIARFGFPLIYELDAVASLVFIVFMLAIPYRPAPRPATGQPLQDLFSGLLFVWSRKMILAAITLDLFAVLLGGATALLPIFADDILHVGPSGLGWLRAAPSLGAVAMGLALAHLRPMHRPGVSMLVAVAGFGVATIAFGLSRSFWLSIAALAVTGACDNISVVVRHSLVQLLTPGAMRGRVSAVNNIFIGSSNELGTLESGITAALFGPVLSVVGGGVATVLVVLGAWRLWPELQRLPQLHRLQSGEAADREQEAPPL